MIFKPLSLSPEMMRAYLDGRKTQTRQLIKLPIEATEIKAPIQSGEFIWWQEAWNLIDLAVGYAVEANFIPEEEEWPEFEVVYEADQSDFIDSLVHKWSRPELMPKRACRAVAEVLEVRAEQAQEISRKDIRAEGVGLPPSPRPYHHLKNLVADNSPKGWSKLHCEFADFWNFLHGPGAWERNEHVWAYKFRSLRGDELKKALEVLNGSA